METLSTSTVHLRIASWRKGQAIYRQGDEGRHWYEVVEGFVALCHYFGDGRRQVSRFAGRGDAFGFESGLRQFSAEALTDVGLVGHAFWDDRAPPIDMTPPSGSHPALQRALEAVENTMRLFSYPNAMHRTAAFLLQFSTYCEQPDIIELPMSRQDLADHLGLTMHTVSRSFSELARRSFFILEKPDRLKVLDRSGLEAMVEFEKMQGDDQLVA
ncbi:helix-turn-helix domain-containing protein [Qipengyuania sp. MTN3-11]|uniref:helix-turn-helix domain-containing protein n=1 Tax=Qipengyuania sp. MTN3-11 TaxID=3056557 RepID=UPI0036F22DAB